MENFRKTYRAGNGAIVPTGDYVRIVRVTVSIDTSNAHNRRELFRASTQLSRNGGECTLVSTAGGIVSDKELRRAAARGESKVYPACCDYDISGLCGNVAEFVERMIRNDMIVGEIRYTRAIVANSGTGDGEKRKIDRTRSRQESVNGGGRYI